MASPFCSHPSGSGNNANASVTFTATSGSDVAAVNSNAPSASSQPQASPHLVHYVTGGGACEPTNGVQLGLFGSDPGCGRAVQPSDPTAAHRSLTPSVSLARGAPQAVFGQPLVAPPTSASGATFSGAYALSQGPAFATASGFAPGPQPRLSADSHWWPRPSRQLARRPRGLPVHYTARLTWAVVHRLTARTLARLRTRVFFTQACRPPLTNTFRCRVPAT